ncbi:DUF2164 domain-containing protein [Dongshaea marina]|uniref:DUF2164 domain-containing protein n=1 Tax=Dongshaea marina TaxID=2047966 RepID=UPI000D3E6137|nr:DUF2164 domain-containing protein [Dongshaea marina]
MSAIQFSNEEKAEILTKIQKYLLDELDLPLEQFDAEFLLDFLSKELGPYFYNRAIYDAQSLLEKQMDNLHESLYLLEKSS